MDDEIIKRVDGIKRAHPSLDERLQRYRASRKTYDADRAAPKRTQGYRRQRGVTGQRGATRGYRV